MKKTIVVVVGTRPEAVKLIPVYLQLIKSQWLEPILISTGQHSELLNQVFQCFNIIPSEELRVMKHGVSLAGLTSRLFASLDEVIGKINPELIMVQGDTCSAWVASMVGYYHRIKVAHVEAGLRTGDKYNPFPEEIYRTQITQIADINFTPTSLATENLIKEGVSNIYEVGNTVVDMLKSSLEIIQNKRDYYQEKFKNRGFGSAKTVLITCHRRENIDRMSEIARAITTLAKRYPELNFVLPIHLNPLVRHRLTGNLDPIRNIFLIDALPYDEFIYLLAISHIVLTDSGGVQEEAASCHTPFIVLREKSERNEAVISGCGVMGGTSHQLIIEAFESIHSQPEVYQSMKLAQNPFGDGKAAEAIVKILEGKLAFMENTKTKKAKSDLVT